MAKTLSSRILHLKNEIAIEDNGTMGKILTEVEWADATPPFYYVRIEMASWNTLEYEIATKWCQHRCSGWVYVRDHRFVFEQQEDYVLFKLWMEDKPMKAEHDVVIPLT